MPRGLCLVMLRELWKIRPFGVISVRDQWPELLVNTGVVIS
jgi:hypothetical protein